jgi:hypothetical protein
LKTRKEQGKNREKAEKHIAKCYKKKKMENLTKPYILLRKKCEKQ